MIEAFSLKNINLDVKKVWNECFTKIVHDSLKLVVNVWNKNIPDSGLEFLTNLFLFLVYLWWIISNGNILNFIISTGNRISMFGFRESCWQL